METLTRATLAISLVFGLFLGACGDDDDDGSAGSGAGTGGSDIDAGDTAGTGGGGDSGSGTSGSGGEAAGTGGSEAGDDAGSQTALLGFGEECTEDDQCEGGVCHQFGQEDSPLCTQECSGDENCPEGSQGKKCNNQGVCRP
jgi:hypothetical protein